MVRGAVVDKKPMGEQYADLIEPALAGVTLPAPPVPPGTGMGFYDHMPVRYVVASSQTAGPLFGDDDFRAVYGLLLARFGERAWNLDRAQVFAHHVVPGVGRAPVQPPWSGGTWGKRCGSAMFVPDPDSAIARHSRSWRALSGQDVRSALTAISHDPMDHARAWHLNGVRDVEEPGFFVECGQKFRHEGACADAWWEWDCQALVPTAGLPGLPDREGWGPQEWWTS